MRGKLVKVLDRGTEIYMLVIRFDEPEFKALRKLGWGVSTEYPTLLVHLHGGGPVGAAMSNFDYPPSDLVKQSVKMAVNNTTIKFSKWIRQIPMDEIPATLDVREIYDEEELW